METEIYTPEQLKEKIKGYGRKLTASVITMVAGGAIVLSSLAMFPSPKIPNLGKEYINAKETLTRLLRFEYDYKNLVFSYKNKELNFILSKDTAQISRLEKALTIVESDIAKMEENPEYIKYVSKKNKRDKEHTYGFFIGLGVYVLGCIGRIIFFDKKKRLEWKQMLK